MKNSVFFIYLLILAGSTLSDPRYSFYRNKRKDQQQLRAIFSILYSVCSFNRHDYSGSVLCYYWWVGAAAGLIAAVIFALKGKGLTTVAVASCVAVFIVELFH